MSARSDHRWINGGAIALIGLLLLLWWVTATPRAQAEADVTPTAPANSSPIALSADGHLIWVVNPDDNSVSVIGNLDSAPSLIKKFSVGREPQGVALDTNDVNASQYRVYVANAADDGITIIKVTASSANSVAAVVETPLLVTGAEPWNVVASPDGKRVFVANSGQDTITVLRTDTNPPTVVGNVELANSSCNVGDSNRHFQPRGMAVTLNSDRLYVTRFLSFTKTGGVQADDAGKEGIVCQLDLPADLASLPSVAGPVALAAAVTGFAIDSNGDGTPDQTSAYPNQMQSIVLRGNRAYLPNIASSPSRPLRFNVDTQAFVSMFDNAATGAPADGGVLNLHLGARDPEPGKKKLFFANPWAIGFSNQSGAGNAYVVSSGSDLLVKLDVDAAGAITFTGDISTTRYIDLNDPNSAATSGLNAGKNPLGLVIRNDKAFVVNHVSRNVSVVNLTTDAVEKVVATSSMPPVGSPDEQLLVGKEIFFAARGHFDRPGGTTVSTDERLSSEGWQNCASCHFAGLTDGTVWSFGAGPRKSVPLNATWSPHNPDDQRILNYSAIFDEVQDFELNIRNVSGPGPLSAGPPPVLDPAHGLIISDTGDINSAPAVVNAFALPNSGRQQHKVTLANSNTAWPALDALKEWVRFAIRTPGGALTTAELSAGGGNPSGGLSATDVARGRVLFFRAGCQSCHGGTKWTVSSKDFVSPPAAGEAIIEADGNGATDPNPNQGQFLHRFLRDIGSFNLNVAGAVPPNQILGQPPIGGIEKDATGRDGLGLDYDGNGKGAGFNIPALLGIWAVPPYYHNGACETLACVLADTRHRTAGLAAGQADPLGAESDRNKVIAFLKTLDAGTDFPFDLSVRRHDIFVDPPTVFSGAQVLVGANVSLFGTRADLSAQLAEQSLSQVSVLLQVTTNSGTQTFDLPLAPGDFNQDFGQAVVSTTVNIPGGAAGIGRIAVTVDEGGKLAETNEGNNLATRLILIRTAPTDSTPPAVSAARISDDNPFVDDDPVTQTRAVRVKIVASDPASPPPASGVTSYCIVTYFYDVVTRRWVEQACVFTALPAPETGTLDTFIVNATLPAREGVAYAFVWVQDGAGNISRTPGFDVISFIPATPISVARNDARIFRLALLAGQTLQFTAVLQNGGFGDVDVAVFEPFTSATAPRVALSANNGLVDESVTLVGPGRFQVEVRAVVNSRFSVTLAQPLAAATATGPAPGPAAGEGVSAVDDSSVPLVTGPPALRTEIGDVQGLYLPYAHK
jgi:DNA-binding beta-propeller fold protein YncE